MKRIIIVTTGFPGNMLLAFAQSAIWHTAHQFFAGEVKLTQAKMFEWRTRKKEEQDLIIFFALDGQFINQVKALSRDKVPHVVVYPNEWKSDQGVATIEDSQFCLGICYTGDLYEQIFQIFSQISEKYELKPVLKGVC